MSRSSPRMGRKARGGTTAGDLLRAPRPGPAAVLPAAVPASDPAHVRALQRPASTVVTVPASRSCMYCRNAWLAASLATFGRRARRPACHRAVVVRYSSTPPRVAASRRSSREIVDGARPSRRATSRTPAPPARRTAISSRSANDKYRPGSGIRLTGRIPPPSRNQRVPAAGDTPASMPASSPGIPFAIATQNRCRCSRRATGGRPGERIAGRPARAAAQPRGRPIRTPPHEGVATTG
jgi:hypothetical protein